MSDWYDELVTAITEDDRNTVLTVVQRLPNIPEAAQILKEDGGNLVYAACQKGYIEVLECLSYLGVVFTETNTEKSPIQVACEYGQESIVEWYLERGVPILPGRIKPWEEESPLYIASKNGCHGIVEKLISAEPSLIKDDKVRQCLLYAACLSGDEKTVKKWLSPCIDINHPIQLVKDLTDCEKLTPLYAACSGGHVNIINMLCDTYNDVIFTQSICNDHPEVIGQIIQKYIVPLDGDKSADDLFKKCIGYMQNRNLQVVHNSWLIPYCVTLVELDVSNNCLYELPSCLPWKLQNLKIFNASRNNLKTIEYPEDDVSTNLCLEDLNLSYNKLVKICIELFEIKSLITLNLSNNTLMLLSRSLIHQTDPELDSSSLLKRRSMIQERHWGCSNLRRLDISHNALVMLPVEIHVCTELIHINASYNKLTAFPQPWSCPLEILDLSHNQLERFPVSTELFWSNSLKLLNISDNQLHEINEGIVKLSMLSDLIACNNKIERLPRADVWENRNLHNINLKHNKLGVMVESPNKKRLFSIKKHSNGGDDLPHLEFPVSLAYCLKELRLADNNLDCVPPSICHLRSLEILDLSNNPLIDKLPKHMGYLKNLGVLKLKGVTPTNISPSLLQDNGGKAKEIISELLVTLRDCKPYNKIKAVVLGKKDKGKTTLVNILGGKKSQKLETKSIVRKEISLTKKTLAVWKDTEIKLNVWDISGDEVYTQIHHSVFTPITLYILVWDFWSITEELDKIAAWISNIQAKSTSFQIVLVGTFIDRLGKLKPDSVKVVNEELVKKFGEDLAPRLCPVSCINNDGIDDLKVALYETAFSMKMPTRGRPPVIGRKIPSSYTMMEKKIIEVQKCLEEESKPLYLTQSEYTEVIESISNKDNDLQSTEETNAVTRFLEEIGVILHFSDQLGALDTLYFLDPAWLCDILVHILICPEGKKLLKQERGQIKRSSAERLYEQCEQFPSKFVKQYIELLERFEIATYISQTDRLFFPCQLPIDPPIIQTTQSNDVEIVRRLYKMSECPSGFWMRLITRMMIRVEQYEKKNWKLKPSVGKSMRLMTLRRSAQRPGSFNKHGRFCGLTINKPKQTYSREMIHVSHEDGSFCVEPVNFTSGDLHKGVLITEESKTANFAMMGVIVDEIEDIVQDFYPGLLELDAVTMGYHLERYALCSTCYQDVPLSNKIDHFTMEHCARMLVNEECITCPKGVKQELKVLVPDLLMKEIPGKFFMDISKLSFKETKENCLGAGVTGSVFKASYDGVPVAIKIYRSDIRNATKIKTTDSTNSDSGTATLSTQGSMDEKIYENLSDAVKLKCLDEAESIKSLRAIREMRQEVGITSRLQHPCIISLIGLAFRPKLMMALELAPLGSFRDILDKELQTRPEFNRYKNKDELFQPLFDKELTYKFVYQIAKGLEYLHSYGIIYKDLKSDNILAVSTNLHDPVNLKLSDYGISKFSWGGRSVGLVGTPGYQAPEILDGRPYDEKVDIFSFSMVIYEILTGKRPYYDCENLAQIIKAMKTEGRRPSIKDMRILTKFPCLESMMTACWENMAVLRPSAKILSSKCYMQNVQFLAQTWNVEDPDNVPFSDRCVLGPSESGSKPVLCIWDTLEDVSSFTIMDPDWLTIPVKRTKYECPHVVCMTTAGKHIWVGHKSCATVYSPRSGELAKIGCYELDDSPVQILSCLNSNIKHDGSQGPASEQMNKYKVFVALKHGKLLQFKTQKNVTDDSCVMRKTTKKIDGYSNPSSIVLRTKRINCMAVAHCKNELWIGSVGYIDIVDCQDFKVNSDRRINTVILLGMCKLPSQLHVYQIVNYKSQMYCLFDNSPYVLEFCAHTYICKTVFTLDGIDVYSKMVATKLIFTDEDHEAYLGLTYSDDSDSDLSPSGECPPAVPPRSYIAPPVPRRNKSVSKKAQRLLGIDSVIGEVSDTDSRQRPSIPPKPVRPKTFGESCGPPPPRPPRGKTLDPNSGRNLPGVERNQSFSLPNMPKHDYTVLVTSIAIVKDTLWVGRSCGSISVVNIAEDTNFTYGRVIADLYKRHRELLSQKSIESEPKTIEAVKLINTGKYVAARYLQSGKESWDVAVAFWEGYGSHDIKRIDKYNLDIMNIEKNLARCSIGDPGFIASNSEEY